jgi:hypothetical protein
MDIQRNNDLQLLSFVISVKCENIDNTNNCLVTTIN